MNAVLSPISTDASLTDLALAYHGAVAAQNALRNTHDEYMSRAYLCIEGAISALRADGTMLDTIARLEDEAHKLAPHYEIHRALQRDIDERVFVTRGAMGFERSLARELNALADEIGDDSAEAEERQRIVLEVASMVDIEDWS